MSDPDDADEEWEFTLQDLKEREEEAEAREAEAERRREPLEAGDPSLENVAFVLLGALLALFVLSRLFLL